MVTWDRMLTAIREDISASTRALEQLGERDADAREWIDSDRPSGITDWVRELQRSADGNAELWSLDSGASDE